MKFFGTLLLATLFIVGSTQSCLASETFILDHDHTAIGFNVSYLLVSSVSGEFDDFKGSFIIDREHPENNNADIIIETASVDTGLDWRDEDIRGPDLFNSLRYPTMVFHSNKIEMRSDNTGQITGDLTLLGITKPVRLDFVKVPGKDKSLTNGYKVIGKIKRSDFGMNAFVRPIGNVVTLLVCYNVEECSSGDVYQNKAKPRYNQ